MKNHQITVNIHNIAENTTIFGFGIWFWDKKINHIRFVIIWVAANLVFAVTSCVRPNGQILNKTETTRYQIDLTD